MTGELKLPVGPDSVLVDGRRAWLEGLDLDAARPDPGPSPAGNAGPYLKAPRGAGDDRTVYRLYCRWWVGSVLRLGGLRMQVQSVHLGASAEGWTWVLVVASEPRQAPNAG